MSMMKEYLMDEVMKAEQSAGAMINQLAAVTGYNNKELSNTFSDYVMDIMMDGEKLDAKAMADFVTITLEKDW